MLSHEKMKNKKVEDIEISRFLKKHKIKIACVSGKKNITCRMYKSYNETINGFSKNITSFFGNSFVITVMFWLITTFGFIPVLIFLPLEFLIVYLIAFVLTRLFVSLASCQNITENICYSIIQQFVLGNIILQTLINKKNNKLIWKERNIY